MARLIDKDALLKNNDKSLWVDWCDKEIFDAIIEEAPTVDAVEVVRCKDCEHSYLDTKCRILYCKRQNSFSLVSEEVEPDDYCSYGERKESE